MLSEEGRGEGRKVEEWKRVLGFIYGQTSPALYLGTVYLCTVTVASSLFETEV